MIAELSCPFFCNSKIYAAIPMIKILQEGTDLPFSVRGGKGT